MVDFSHIVYLREQRATRARSRVAMAAENLRAQREEHQQLETQRKAFLIDIHELEIGLVNALLDKTVTINDVLRVDEIMRVATQRGKNLADKVNAALRSVEDATTLYQQHKDALLRFERKREKSLEVLASILEGERLRFLRQDEEKMDEYVGFTVAKRAMHE
ncbi:hypothetical protein [Ochrobactrum sp. Marseille-Q0166]|uniref:hypothetical protein n=1 Tax=Ochrobactrum sp. Marseille-Q0166 TaxID=2761105 RepID=UPI0016556475|nr:hypothetical protein [Ochrobactrum sp. Marseille-Q0166]MBC8719595.1 hypothetical protein [Ochrobactrum sp. Marseille-Q0166]